MEPVVSVIVPGYHTKPYIARAMTSVLDRTFADVEIIVVTDVARAPGDARVRVRVLTSEERKRGEFVTALAAVACNPRCVVQACVRCQRAFTQRWAESQATAPVPSGFQRAASGDAA